jgi:gamma-D-glutamyl-L-lysine dipeptidyl-peptidase
MEFGFVSIPASPVRIKASHKSEMVNQLLFGESVKVLREKKDLWIKIQSIHDGYEGWINRAHLESIEEKTAKSEVHFISNDLLVVLELDGKKMNIPAGASLPGLVEIQPGSGHLKGRIGSLDYTFFGKHSKRDEQNPGIALIEQLTIPWLNAPYLWGGRTPLGVDCSGFVQVIFKMIGFDLSRDAWQQAQQGNAVKKFSEAQPGDLAFFDNQEDIVHTGILLGDEKIIHASGRVKIDNINKKGIIDATTGKRTTRLRAIRRFW